MVYSITYISAKFNNNQKLIDSIKENCLGWAILSPSFYLVATESKQKSNEDIKRLHEIVSPFLDPNDKIFISLLAGQASWKGLNSEQLVNWLDTYLHPRKLGETSYDSEQATSRDNVSKHYFLSYEVPQSYSYDKRLEMEFNHRVDDALEKVPSIAIDVVPFNRTRTFSIYDKNIGLEDIRRILKQEIPELQFAIFLEDKNETYIFETHS